MTRKKVLIDFEEYEELKRKHVDNYALIPEKSKELRLQEIVERVRSEGGLLFEVDFGLKAIGFVTEENMAKRLESVNKIPKWVRELFKCNI